MIDILSTVAVSGVSVYAIWLMVKLYDIQKHMGDND